MIILNGAASNGDQLLVNSNSAGFANIAIHASYIDYNNVTGVVTPAANDVFVSANVANQIVVANVANANNSRNIKSVIIHNANASANNTISIAIANGAANANLYTLYAYTLLPGESLQYFDESGWQVLNANGQTKVTAFLSSGSFQGLTIHTANATHTTGANTNTVRVRLIGGGGGGAGVAGNASNQAYGSGGAAGGLTEFTTPVLPNTGDVVVVGAGGAAGANNANGGNGANSNWTGNATNGTVVWTAQGGANGQNMANGATNLQGVGGAQTPANSANNPQVQAGGSPGDPAYRVNGTFGHSGAGGSSFIGAGGTPVVQNVATAGTVGTAGILGGGGSGAGGNSNANGGAGGSGIIIVEEYS